MTRASTTAPSNSLGLGTVKQIVTTTDRVLRLTDLEGVTPDS